MKHPILLYLKNFYACVQYFEKLSVVERIIPFFVSHTQAPYTYRVLTSTVRRHSPAVNEPQAV